MLGSSAHFVPSLEVNDDALMDAFTNSLEKPVKQGNFF